MATFYNQATLSYNGNIASSNITAGEILENLFVTKTPVNSSYSADRDNSYVISIVNNSSVSYDNVTITDDLGEYVFNPPDIRHWYCKIFRERNSAGRSGCYI